MGLHCYPFKLSERILFTTFYTAWRTQDNHKIFRIHRYTKSKLESEIVARLIIKPVSYPSIYSLIIGHSRVCVPDLTVALVRIFQKMCSCCYISALSFFTGFEICHKILLGQGTRQATRWLRMIYFPGFRLGKKEHRKKVSTYLWTCRIWEIKEPWSPASTDSFVISKPLLQYPVTWPSDLDFNIFSNETRSYEISLSWLDRCWWARSSSHWCTMSFR